MLGVPDEEWGERVVAFVVGDVELDDLRDYVRDLVQPARVGAAPARACSSAAAAAQRQGPTGCGCGTLA